MVNPMSRQRLGVNRSRWLLDKRITPGKDIRAEGHRMTLFALPPRSDRHGLHDVARAAPNRARHFAGAVLAHTRLQRLGRDDDLKCAIVIVATEASRQITDPCPAAGVSLP